MSLVAGTRLGPYEIQSAIGAGGMGEVYRARDTRLDRTVAIKILPPDVSGDPDRRARFEREAKTVAALNHAHICTLYDVGDHKGQMFLVMEHLAGQTLAERLEKGPLPLEQALAIATEIADALSAAHRQGVVHRDLKPANVMLTKSGAKLLDFGLAKLTGHGEQPAAAYAVSAVPTQAATLTGQGVIVGTLQYMAPEQLEGKPPDARTDLWALGAIVYEMVTGKRAFEGTSAVSLMSAIIEREPAPITSLQPLTPPALDRLVRLCLAKAPDDRPDSAHDVANDLRWTREDSDSVLANRRSRAGRRSWELARVAPLAVICALTGAATFWFLQPRTPLRPFYSSADVRPADELNSGGAGSPWTPTPGGSLTAFAWTPDGRSLIFVGRSANAQRIFVRPMDVIQARVLEGTEGAQSPTVSADGQSVAFWARGAIKRVPLSGGPVMPMATVARLPRGMVWDRHGRLLFGVHGGPICEVTAQGEVRAVTKLGEAELGHELPSPLTDDQLLFTVRKRELTSIEDEIHVYSFATGVHRPVLRDATDARYVSTGHLLFLRRGQLFAVRFDPEQSRVQGPELAVLDGVAQAWTAGNSTNITGAGQYAVASSGTLAWVPAAAGPNREWRPVVVERTGQVSQLPSTGRSYGELAGSVRLCPDGRRLALPVLTATGRGIWVYDLVRPSLRPVVQANGEADWPTWSSTGAELLFSWVAGGRRFLVVQAADGGGPRTLVEGAYSPSGFTPDGRVVAVGNRSIVTISAEGGSGTVRPLVENEGNAMSPALSPDGDWLLYTTDKSGSGEVYLRSFSGSGGPDLVSPGGNGCCAAWHPNGREIFYVRAAGGDLEEMMVVPFSPHTSAPLGQPHRLFQFNARELTFSGGPIRRYDVGQDGRFYLLQTSSPPPAPVITHVNLIVNWFEELKAKVPPAQ